MSNTTIQENPKEIQEITFELIETLGDDQFKIAFT